MSTRSAPSITVIEDEPDILELISYNLEREGYRVTAAEDGQRGLELVRQRLPDLLLLDLMLPGIDGLEICRRLRADPATRTLPIIIVSAKGEESEIVLGLGLGADDYVTKPFSPRELIARVQAMLRRAAQDGGQIPERITLDGLSIDLGRHEVLLEGEPVHLTATEFKLLHHLAAHPGRVYTRDQLIDHVMGGSVVVIDRNIDVHVRAVRKKLGAQRDRIETIRGVGYRFSDAP